MKPLGMSKHKLYTRGDRHGADCVVCAPSLKRQIKRMSIDLAREASLLRTGRARERIPQLTHYDRNFQCECYLCSDLSPDRFDDYGADWDYDSVTYPVDGHTTLTVQLSRFLGGR